MSYYETSIAAGYKIVEDANLQDMTSILGCELSSAKVELEKSLALATITKPEILITRRRAIMSLRATSEKRGHWNARFKRLAEIEKDVIPFFDKESTDKDSLENDAIAQLSFQDDIFKPLNHIPWMVMMVALFKVWAVPAMTLMTPILAWILPYLLLKFVYALPISQQEYTRIIQTMWSGNMNLPTFNDTVPNLLTPRSIGQFIIFGFSFAQSMIQPIQNAMHLYKTDRIVLGLGQKLLEVRKILNEFRAEISDLGVPLTSVLDEFDDSDPRRAFILINEQPERLSMALRDLARLEILWRFATVDITLSPVEFKRDRLFLKDVVDISLKAGIPSTLTLAEQPHAIITGPNGGGKSSFLRACLQSVVLGHAYGVAPAAVAQMPRFLWIASGLQLRDTPGLYSMFETEVKFAADCIRAAKTSGPGLVLFDELFHSTNPPDGARSAELFLKQLWAVPNTFSIVSTHVFPLVEAKPDTVQAICCPAEESPDGLIQYSFEARPGVCRVSSVHTVWEKFGLRRGRQDTGKLSSTKRKTEDA